MAQTKPPNPVDQYGNAMHHNSGYASAENDQSENGRSPLSMSLGFLKNLTEKKSTRVDGQPLKRRGPKPDSKPALTRRQELNRQAQRTHRERKELYIKALEQEVLHLKEKYAFVARTKDSLCEENQRLKALLAQHGIAWNGSGGVDELSQLGHSTTSYAGSSNVGSFSGPSSGSASPGNGPMNPGVFVQGVGYEGQQQQQQQGGNGRGSGFNPAIDYDQAGIDFVLTLERPCMEHMPFLLARSDNGEDPCGHALMASCPPTLPVPPPTDRGYDLGHPETLPNDFSSFPKHIPFGHGTQMLPPGDVEERMGQQIWDLKKGDLALLLDLSRRLNLEQEITPVMAWGMVLSCPGVEKLGLKEVEGIREELRNKIKCYGFGAVLEDFEVRDALQNAFESLSTH